MRTTLGAQRSAVAQMGAFAAAAGGVIGGLAWALVAVVGGASARRAVLASAVLAFGVQVVAFAVAQRARRAPGRPIMTGWVAGMVMRLVAVAVYAVVVVPARGLDPTAALMSLAVFLFLSTLLEPWLLK